MVALIFGRFSSSLVVFVYESDLGTSLVYVSIPVLGAGRTKGDQLLQSSKSLSVQKVCGIKFHHCLLIHRIRLNFYENLTLTCEGVQRGNEI
jgi:hypothetical protein